MDSGSSKTPPTSSPCPVSRSNHSMAYYRTRVAPVAYFRVGDAIDKFKKLVGELLAVDICVRRIVCELEANFSSRLL